MAKSDISKAQQATSSATNTAETQGGNYAGAAGTGYQNFATTGGVTPEEQTLTRQQTAQGIGSLYDSLKANAARRNAIQGGYTPGYSAQNAQLSRDAASSVGNALTSTNLGLLEQIRQGKLAGLGGQAGLAGMYLGQVPQLLGTNAQLAEAKPSWYTGVEGLMSGAGQLASGIGGAAAGFA